MDEGPSLGALSIQSSTQPSIPSSTQSSILFSRTILGVDVDDVDNLVIAEDFGAQW
jgi:hypothetical protein